MRQKQTNRIPYNTVSGQRKTRKRYGIFIVLFILMMITVVFVFYGWFQYSRIETAYDTNIYRQELQAMTQASSAEKQTQTHAVIVLDNREIEGTQVEDVSWVSLHYIDSQAETVQAVSLPLNLQSKVNGQGWNSYAMQGIEGVVKDIQQLTGTDVNYVTVIRMQQIRPLAEVLNPIELTAPTALIGGDLTVQEGDTLQLTPRQVMQVNQALSHKTKLEQMRWQRQLLDSMTDKMMRWENLLSVQEQLPLAQHFTQTNIPLENFIEIYWQDRYNLTNVYLDELVQLESQENTDAYAIDLVDFQAKLKDFVNQGMQSTN